MNQAGAPLLGVTEFITCLTIVSARDLPKTDLLSKIDPYIVVRVNGQEFKTRVIDDNDNPTWNERFYPRLGRSRTGLLEGPVELMLYDEDPLKDSYVARHTIDLSTITLEQFNKPMTFSLTYVKDKYLSQGCNPTITVMFQGLLQSYNSIRTMFAPVPGFVHDDVRQSCYIPVCDAAGVVYLGVEYEKGCVDVKVYVTRPGTGLYVDLFVEGACQSTKVRRRCYSEGLVLANGQLTAYEEVKLNDAPITMDFSSLVLMVFDAHVLTCVTADKIVSRHGWRGALNFQQATRSLQGVQYDHKEQEVYMLLDENETVLVVDYDEDDVDVKLAVLAHPQTRDKGYDLVVRGQDVNKTSELYTPPKPRLNGSLAFARKIELDDLAYGTHFADIKVVRYQLTNPRRYSVQGVARLMG